ncbi:MAG: glycosyltransferase [Oligoflexia bacterium]|nr:glycosyltransferase [Oligoflexia bacterium]
MDRIVSIILPYYNGKAYIDETLQSIIDQTYKNFEVLVIDDGSPNEDHAMYIRQRLIELNDQRFQYIHKMNGGLSDTRNFGIAKANGFYIAFIDQDDIWVQEKLEEQLKIFENDESIPFIFSNMDIITAAGERRSNIFPKWFTYKTSSYVKRPYDLMLRGNFVTCSSVIFKKELAIAAGPSNRFFVTCPDYELFIRMAKVANCFYYINKPLFTYRIHNENSSNNAVRVMSECLWILFNGQLDSFVRRKNAMLNFCRMMYSLAYCWGSKIYRSYRVNAR